MIGRQVSHFYIIRTLGSGGMGTVYEAQDTRLPRSVAIKFLNPALANKLDAVRRFKREASHGSHERHENHERFRRFRGFRASRASRHLRRHATVINSSERPDQATSTS